MENHKYRISRKHAHQYCLQHRNRLIRSRRAMLAQNNDIEHSDNSEMHEDDEEMQVTSLVNEQMDTLSEDNEFVHSIESISSIDADEPTNNVNNEDIEDDMTTMDDFKERLGCCFVNADLSHSQANRILTCLRTVPNLCALPEDVRTILQTPRTPCQLQSFGNGAKYLHSGFEAAVLDILRQTPLNLVPNQLLIDFNIDGASLDKSSKHQIWPIQIRICNIKKSKPETAEIYLGTQKPE
ncbi:hypothetical protein PV327_011475, partial [Microctonus hyperodae]